VRRFVGTLPGRTLCHTVVMALLLPMLTLILMTRAEAQLQSLPTWAVVDFQNLSGSGGPDIGSQAADAVANELANTNKYDIVPREQVKRVMDELGIRMPLDQTALFRLRDALRVTEVVTGEVVNYRVVPVEGGKRADVIMRIVVKNVNQGTTVNGAALTESSGIRPSDTADALIIGEAFTNAAVRSVGEMVARQLPKATLLNTWEKTAVINQGARSGFQNGMELIILRGTLQVATARVTGIEPDSATITIIKNDVGHRPGDTAQAVYTVPEVYNVWGGRTGDSQSVVKPTRVKKAGANTGFFQLLLVGALLFLLFSNGNASGNDVVESTKAEATFNEFQTSPSIRVSWDVDIFVRGDNQKQNFIIYRSDVPNTPVGAVAGSQNNYVDTSVAQTFTYLNPAGLEVLNCNAQPGTVVGTGVPVPVGQPVFYQVQLVYSVSAVDIPGGGTDPGARCFFASDRDTSRGPATALNRPEVVTPSQGAVFDTADELNAPRFTFEAPTSAQPITVEYILELSNSPQFPKGRTFATAPLVSNVNSTLNIAPGPINGLPSYLRTATTIWWRVGARNIDDNPGPVPASTGRRYIMSIPRSFTVVRDDVPPPPSQ
jgi:hypothetical protein